MALPAETCGSGYRDDAALVTEMMQTVAGGILI